MGCGSSRSPVRVGIILEDDETLYPGKANPSNPGLTLLEVIHVSFLRGLLPLQSSSPHWWTHGCARVPVTLLHTASPPLLRPTPLSPSAAMSHSCSATRTLHQRGRRRWTPPLTTRAPAAPLWMMLPPLDCRQELYCRQKFQTPSWRPPIIGHRQKPMFLPHQDQT